MPLRPGSSTTLVPPVLPHVVHARDHPANALAAAVARGALARVGRGTYLPATAVSPRADALARTVGTHARLTTDHAFSHTTAAMLHGLPLWRTPDRTHVRMAVTGGGRRDPTVVRHRGIPGDSVVDVLGLPCTDLERTTWDCLLSLPALDGLVVADAALRAGVSADALAARVRSSVGVRGVPRARAVLEHADAGAESPGESGCRWAVLRDGFPAPATQVPVLTRLGTFWLDLGWPEWRVGIEYDGSVKYRTHDDLVREKRRHDAITEAGWRVIRVTAEDRPMRAGLTSRLAPLLPAAVTRGLRPRVDLAR